MIKKVFAKSLFAVSKESCFSKNYMGRFMAVA